MTAPIYNMARGWGAYVSDDTTTYQIGTTLENITLQGGTAQPVDTNPTFRRGWRPRKIYGVFVSAGVVYRTHVPILSPSNALWVGGTTSFTKGGQTFQVAGKIGEKRENKGG